MEKYLTIFADNLKLNMALPELFSMFGPGYEKPKIWSAKLSDGTIDILTAESEKSKSVSEAPSEVLIAPGYQGLRALVSLGFIPSSAYHPEKHKGFWKIIGDIVQNKHSVNDLESFISKDILPVDTNRVDYEQILPLIGKSPQRLYLPIGSSTGAIVNLRERIAKMSLPAPKIGYHDNRTGSFIEFDLS